MFIPRQGRAELQAAADRANQVATSMLATAIAQGEKNGLEKQLQKLRDLHANKTDGK